jgi:hypothetical protein
MEFTIPYGKLPNGYSAILSVTLTAFDTLSIPAMATECERTFRSAEKLITPERSALSDATIEAGECLKAWWDQGLITRD